MGRGHLAKVVAGMLLFHDSSQMPGFLRYCSFARNLEPSLCKISRDDYLLR